MPERREAMKGLWLTARDCTRCPQLAASRTTVVFGAGNAGADVMLVGEAPGRVEDEVGVPLVGRPGELVDDLLEGVGLARADVFVTTLVKCRPPDNRDPAPGELDNCRDYLAQQVALVAPVVVVALGSVAVRRLRGGTARLADVHGEPEVATIGGRAVWLLPVFDPGAALYQRETVERLREDFARIPELLAAGPPEQRGEDDGDRVAADEAAPPASAVLDGQLPLF